VTSRRAVGLSENARAWRGKMSGTFEEIGSRCREEEKEKSSERKNGILGEKALLVLVLEGRGRKEGPRTGEKLSAVERHILERGETRLSHVCRGMRSEAESARPEGKKEGESAKFLLGLRLRRGSKPVV